MEDLDNDSLSRPMKLAIDRTTKLVEKELAYGKYRDEPH